MVSSVLDPSIQYKEHKKLNSEDFGHVSSIYIIDLYDIPTTIVLGKHKYEFSKKNVVYYPIYIVSNNKIKVQIGVFETTLSKSLSVLDEDGDIDIDKLSDPLLYSFVDKKYIQKMEKIKDATKEKEEETAVIVSETGNLEQVQDEDETDVLSLKVSKNKLSEEKQIADKILEKGIFTIYKSIQPPIPLKEETQEEADEIKHKYKERANNEWIEKFMKNNHYRIVDNEGGGDCLFAVIRDAYEQIGMKTTIEKLRAIVASQVTDEIFQENKRLYDTFENNKAELKKELQDIKESNKLFMKRMKNAAQKEERDHIIEQTKQLKPIHAKKMKELKEIESIQQHYVGFMNNIHNIDQYREYMLTSHYWADSWAISTLENALNMKMIIMSEEAYSSKAYDNVLNCGEINARIEKKKAFNPEHYIMTSYDGVHYKLITYKNKNILTFTEIPYDIKALIVNKCLEKNSGIYYMIQDFRNFKSLLGINPDEGMPVDFFDAEDDASPVSYSKYCNPNTVFVFHKNSLSKNPGKGFGEKIDSDKIHEYIHLSRVNDWRKILDDSYVNAPFQIDGHKWTSIDHYMQASRFKKGYPDFYTQFSLDFPSDLSKDVNLAINVANLTNVKYIKMRPPSIREDTDYHLGRKDLERENALRAKFTQNLDLLNVLLHTKDAVLHKYVRRQPPAPDIQLMKLRYELARTQR